MNELSWRARAAPPCRQQRSELQTKRVFFLSFFFFFLLTFFPEPFFCGVRSDGIRMGLLFFKCRTQTTKHTLAHTHTHTHSLISQNTAAITTIDRAEMAPTTECEGRKKKNKSRTNSLKDSCPRTVRGRSQPRIISYNKIFKNSLYRGLSSLVYTLIYGKETTKIYMYKFIYMPCIY